MSWMKKMLAAGLAAIALLGAAVADDRLNILEHVSAGIVSRTNDHAQMEVHGRYHVTAYDKYGRIKWTDDIDNLVTTVGKNHILDQYWGGSGWTTGTVYMMLKGTGSAAAGDTMASHAGWAELNISASSGARQSVTFAAASGGSKATSSAVSWSITAAGPTTVAGVAIAVGATSTNGNTTGTLVSAGDFGASRSVVSGDTLNVTYTSSLN